MNEHPNDLLLPIAEAALPAQSVAAHLQGCERCRRTLEALSPLDLPGVWQGVAAELYAPRPSLLERGGTRLGIDPALARVAGTTPSLSAAWLLASLLILGLGMQMASFTVGAASSRRWSSRRSSRRPPSHSPTGPASTRPTTWSS